MRRVCTVLLATALGSPAAAATLTPATVFFDAAPLVKLIMAGLVITTVAALVVCGRKVASGPRLAGGSAFLSALRLGGPLVGLLGAAYVGLSIFIGISNASEPVPFQVIAPGLAEVTMLAGLGLLAGGVAVICHWVVESRIDRAVLRS